MAERSNGERGHPGRSPVGSIRTAIVVSQAKRGVVVELGAREMLLPRTRYGTAADHIEGVGYGDALTVEVVADPGRPGGIGLSRIGIERSLRQPRAIEGIVRRCGAVLELAASDGVAPVAVVIVDQQDVEGLLGTTRRWLVGSSFRDLRFLLVDGPDHGNVA